MKKRMVCFGPVYTIYTCKLWKKRKVCIMVLLLQFTPVNCTKQGKPDLVLFLQFTPVNCEKKKVSFGSIYTIYTLKLWKKRKICNMILLLQFTSVNCTKQGKSVLVLFIQFTYVNCEKTEGLFGSYLDSLHLQFLLVKFVSFCFMKQHIQH